MAATLAMMAHISHTLHLTFPQHLQTHTLSQKHSPRSVQRGTWPILSSFLHCLTFVAPVWEWCQKRMGMANHLPSFGSTWQECQ